MITRLPCPDLIYEVSGKYKIWLSYNHGWLLTIINKDNENDLIHVRIEKQK